MPNSYGLTYGFYSNSGDTARTVESLHQPETTDPLPSDGPSTRSEVHFILQLETGSHAKSTTGRHRLLASAVAQSPSWSLGGLC